MYCAAIHNTGPHEEWVHRLTPGGCKALCWLARNAVLASVPVPNADEASAETTPADTLADNPEKESRRSALHLARLAPHSLSRDINCRACFCQCQCSRQCSGRACALTQSRRFVLRLSAAQPVPQVLHFQPLRSTGMSSRPPGRRRGGMSSRPPAGLPARQATGPPMHLLSTTLNFLRISTSFNVF